MSFFKKRSIYNPNGDKHLFDQLLFSKDSELLRSYCAEFIKGKMAPECNTNARLLVEYFNVHGKLLDLMKEVAKREIDNTNMETQVFRGNTAFTRLYGEYSHLCLLPYLRSVTKEIIQTLISEDTKLNPDALDFADAENSKESIETFCRIAKQFANKLVDSIFLLPSHFHQLIRFISVEIGKKGSAKSTPVNTFNLLFFIRTIFPVFHAPQHVMDSFQPPSPEMARRLTAFSKTCQTILNEITPKVYIQPDVISLMTGSATKLFELFTHPRSGYMTEKSGLDFSLQTNAHKNIVDLIRANIDPLCGIMQRDVDKLKEAMKQDKEEDSVMAEMQQSLEFCSNIYSQRLKAVEDEISDLSNEIERYKQQLKQVQKAIQEEDELTLKLQEEINKLESEGGRGQVADME